MALCEKYRMDIHAERLICPDPHVYCAFREACGIFASYEEWLERGEQGKEV